MPLPITSFFQMAVDAAHGHIFISQDSASQSSILVTDLTGQVVTTITGQTGVTGLALSPDGSTLYAALSNAVTAISTATLAQTASYPLPAGDSPEYVAVQSGKVWVSYFTGRLGAGAIGYINPSAISPAFHTPATMKGWNGAPKLAADPQDTGVLVAIGSDSGLASYDTATSPVTTIAGSPGGAIGCSNGADLAVAPGGSEFMVPCFDPANTVGVYSTANLSELRSLVTGTGPSGSSSSVAVAYDAAGDVAAGSTTFVPNPDLYIYPPDSTTALNGYSLYAMGGPGGILRGVQCLANRDRRSHPHLADAHDHPGGPRL